MIEGKVEPSANSKPTKGQYCLHITDIVKH